jgi:hypothetical protein
MIKYFRKKGGFERVALGYFGPMKVGEPLILMMDNCEFEVSTSRYVGLFSGEKSTDHMCISYAIQRGSYFEECDENGNKL